MMRKMCKSCKKKIDRSNADVRRESVVCSIECALDLAATKRHEGGALIASGGTRTMRDIHKLAQAKFNRYILTRDYGLSCISCGKHADGGHRIHASHFLDKSKYPRYRYNAYNVNAACQQCNRHRSGNLLEYRVGLENKYGRHIVDFFDWVIDNKKGYLEYKADHVSRLGKIFSARERHLKRIRG